MQCMKTTKHIHNITLYQFPRHKSVGRCTPCFLFLLLVLEVVCQSPHPQFSPFPKNKQPKKKKKKSTTKIFNNLTHRVCSSTISAGVCYFIMGTWKRSVHVQESRKYMFMEARSAHAESKGIYKERKFLGQENILASVATVSM